MNKVDIIAAVAHSINAAYCKAMGDNSQKPWDKAEEFQKLSCIAGVNMHLENPDATPEQSHESWLAQKTAEGWAYGEEKDLEKKLHPCFKPYDDLPVEQKAKDYLFKAVVDSLRDLPLAEDKALKDEFAKVKAALVLSESKQSQAIKAGTGHLAPTIAVKYIGIREHYTDYLYRSQLEFSKGQVMNVPIALANKFLEHGDLFERATTEDAETAVSSEGIIADSSEDKDRIELNEKFDMIEQVRKMNTKKALADFALDHYQVKLDTNKKVAELQSAIEQMIERYGVL